MVDTDVVSYQFKRDSRATLYDPHLAGNLLVISFMTLAKLYRWPREHNWGRSRRARLERHVRKVVVYHSDRLLCRWWAHATTSARRKGRPIQPADAWIAATALANKVPLVTHNPGDYAGVDGLTIVTEAPP